MPEGQPTGFELDQPGFRSRCERIRRDRYAERDGRSLDRLGDRATIVERGNQQTHPGGGRQLHDPGTEDLLQAAAERQRCLQQRVGLDRGRQLGQRQRIAGRLAQQPPSDRWLQTRCHLAEQTCRQLLGQWIDLQGRKSSVVQLAGDALAEAGEQDDRLGVEAAGNEGEYVGAGLVQPVRILSHQQERRTGVGEQIEGSKSDQVEIWNAAVGKTERGFQGVALGERQRFDAPADRVQQLVQPGIREVLFRLRPSGGKHVHPTGLRQCDRLAE